MAQPKNIYQVSELNHMVGDLLSQSFNLLWIEGEISNLAQPRSGHMYFSLKDDRAQVRCALFRSHARKLVAPPQDGDQVVVRARVGLYQPRGDYQLIVNHMEPAGAGALRLAFERLKAQLQKEGLFNQELKQPLPALPRHIGVVTSATGAALHDVLSVLSRRFPLGHVRVYPAMVQGDAAPKTLIKALQQADDEQLCDVILLTRGGGSLEDLQAFNDEALARCIVACKTPIISAVGHEVDTSISDYAADVRAPTPSAAAELVCPDLSNWTLQAQQLEQRLTRSWQQRLQAQAQKLDNLAMRLERQHPRRQLEDGAQYLDRLEGWLIQVIRRQHGQRQDTVRQLEQRLNLASPHKRLADANTKLNHLMQRLRYSQQRQFSQAQQRLNYAIGQLDAVSPLRTLERGYAIAKQPNKTVIKDAQQVAVGEQITVQLHQGELDCTVDAKR